MGVGEILDVGISLARRNYRALVGVGAWAIIPELRARTEGYDLQQRAAQVAGGD